MDGLQPEPPVAARRGGPGWLTRLALSQRFHALAERIPLLRGHARAEGAALFDLVQGFVRSQVLAALVDLRILHRLADGARSAADLATLTEVPGPRLDVLLQAAAALGLVRRRRDLWALTARGAAFVAVPGLTEMVAHHRALYADLADPAAFFRGGTETQLAAFWPYVFGAGIGSPEADRFSRLMAESQTLVAADTLRQVDLRDRRHLMDVGGGHGAFLAAVARSHPHLALTLFDLPQVVRGAGAALGPLASRIRVQAGSFRDDPLPTGADAISLVRVLYDHADATVDALLTRVHAALPPGGLVIVSEPMSGGARPDPATDVYFAVYTLAMRTGRTRSADEIAGRLRALGFSGIACPRPARSFITRVVTARRA